MLPSKCTPNSPGGKRACVKKGDFSGFLKKKYKISKGTRKKPDPVDESEIGTRKGDYNGSHQNVRHIGIPEKMKPTLDDK